VFRWWLHCWKLWVYEVFGRRVLSTVFIFLSLVALGFLLYTLLNLDALGIVVTHPRVMVEFFLFIALLLIGILLRNRTLQLQWNCSFAFAIKNPLAMAIVKAAVRLTQGIANW
jgi:hypothetical protein